MPSNLLKMSHLCQHQWSYRGPLHKLGLALSVRLSQEFAFCKEKQSIILVSMLSKNNKAARAKNNSSTAKASSRTENKESKLQNLVKSHPHFEFIENGKVKCSITGHQFAPTLENYEQHLKSKSYKRAIESKFDISQYEEFLVPFKDNNHFLFCRLTGAKIPKKKTAIERHVNSKRFKFRMEQILAENQEQEEDESLEIVDEEESEEAGEEQEEEQEVEVKKGKRNGKHAK